jgi:hypothetical protein
MADKKISQLTSATTPLGGTEALPIVQSSATVKTTVNDITNGRTLTPSKVLVNTSTNPNNVQFRNYGTAEFESANATYADIRSNNNYIGRWGQGNYVVSGGPSTGFGINSEADLVFGAGGATEIFRATTTGNIKFKTAGNGIDFSANTNAAGMTSELLNDYEEGTWTPTDASVAGLTFTGTSNNCFYTRVGNMVTCVFALVYPTTASTAGAKLAGLPFTSKSTSSSVAGGYVTFTNSSLDINFLIGANDTAINMYLNTGGSIANSQLSTFILRGVVKYFV